MAFCILSLVPTQTVHAGSPADALVDCGVATVTMHILHILLPASSSAHLV